jgi:hypothetical protein
MAYQPPSGGFGQPAPGFPPGGPPPGPQGYPQGKVRPGRLWYLLALLLIVGGVAWLVVSVISLSHQVNSLQRVPLPQGGHITLASSGGYVVYYEGPGAQSGHFASFHVQVLPASPGAAVASLRQYGSTVTYSVGGHHGRAVLVLQVTHPGRFRVVLAGAPSNGSDLAFGSSVASSIVKIVVPSIGLVLLGLALALVILILRIVRKSRQRALLAQGYQQGYPQGYQ